MASGDGVEREYKFDVDEGFRRPDLSAGGRVEAPGPRRQVTTYLDTPTRDLWAKKWALRYREVTGDQVTWTVKQPNREGSADGLAERGEVEWPGRADEVPREALELLVDVGAPPFETVAVLDAVRTRLYLYAPGATAPWGEIDDDTVTVTGGPKAGTRFRQIELELLAGDEPPVGAVDAVIAALTGAGAVASSHSKFALATGL